MDAASHRRQDPPKPTSRATTSNPAEPEREDFDGEPEMWAVLSDNFRQVQTVLDQNRLLIQQVNENHQSKMHENLVKNVALIQEINGNISKVVSLYSNLSTNFSTMFHERNAANKNTDDDD